MAPELTREIPPYLQIANAIAADIESGRLGEGDPIPSLRAISREWGVAAATAARAHGELRQRGLVVAMTGAGTTVSTSGGNRGPQAHLQRTRSSGRVYREGEHAKILSADLVLAPHHIAIALKITEGMPVVRRERITYSFEVPVVRSISWLPGELAAKAPELLVPERVLSGTFALAAVRNDRRVVGGREEVAASLADADDAAALNLSTSDPVLIARSWYLDEEGMVIEYGESTRRAGRWSAHDFSMA